MLGMLGLGSQVVVYEFATKHLKMDIPSDLLFYHQAYNWADL